MIFKFSTFVALCSCLLATGCTHAQEPRKPAEQAGSSQIADTGPTGSLIIVGGALRASNVAIHRQLIDSARLLDGGRLGILPAASGKPDEVSRKFIAALSEYGVPADRVEIIPLAIRDDPTTPDTDESEWQANANDPAVAARIRSLDGIWFTGGDQARIMSVLRNSDGELTPVGDAVMYVFSKGGLIAGTSAGAAFQSEVMLLGGSSPMALRRGIGNSYTEMSEQESGPLLLGKGMPLFPHGIIDQHFDRKARLGRLIVALLKHRTSLPVGFGIEEDTALFFDAGQNRARVIGHSNVVIVDVSNARSESGATHGIEVSLLGHGDEIQWPGPAFTVNPAKSRIENVGYLDIPDPIASGLFSPYGGRLEDALGFLLLDNRGAARLISRVDYPDGSHRNLVFRQSNESSGYWGYLDGQLERYSIIGVELDIEGDSSGQN